MKYRLARFSNTVSVIVYETSTGRYAPATRKGLFHIARAVSGLRYCPCSVYSWSTWTNYTRATHCNPTVENFI